MTTLATRPALRPATTPAPFDLMGIAVRPLVRGSDVAGAYSVLEQVVPAGAGTPPHRLLRQDKVILVLEGEVEITVGDRAHRAGPGDRVVIPRSAVHAFRNPGGPPVRILVTVSPAGHAGFLQGLAALDPTSGEAAALMQAHGVEIV